MSVVALKHLRENEWRMGNGQCHVCYACPPNPIWERQSEHLGHELDCTLALAIESLGGKVEWKRKNNSEARLEYLKFWSDVGEHVINKVISQNTLSPQRP